MTNFERIAADHATVIHNAIAASSGGNNEPKLDTMDRIIEAEGCELWEVIEAFDIVRNASEITDLTTEDRRRIKAENASTRRLDYRATDWDRNYPLAGDDVNLPV